MDKDTIVVRRTTLHQTTIPTDSLRHATMSFRARGVLAFLLTYDNDTLISTADLPNYGTEGRDAVRAALAELRVHGYVSQHREAYTDQKGRQLWMTVTEISDVPATDSQAPETDSQAPEHGSNSRGVASRDTPVIATRSEDGFSGAMSLTTTASSNSSRSLHTSYEDSSTGVTARKGWQRKGSKAEQDDGYSDDATSLLEDPQPEPEPPADLEARREEITRKRRTRAVGPSENLARYFASLAAQRAADGAPAAPGAMNKGALSSQFAAWAREGSTTDQIRMMIETYWEPWFDRSEVVPAWQDFLAKRAYVHSEGLRLAKQEEHEANRYNPDYWRGTPGSGYDAL